MDAHIALLPPSVTDAQRALVKMERDVDAAETYEQLRQLERRAKAIREFYAEVDIVRRQAERTILLAKHRCGIELARAPKAKGTRGQLRGRGVIGTADAAEPIATIEQQIGSAKRGSTLMQLASLPREVLLNLIGQLHDQQREATATGVLKLHRATLTARKREAARNAVVIPDGKDYRVGDCQVVLSDIAPDSVALILTDPPYAADADPLYEWLARFAARVLIPGGSLICYTGQSRLDRDIATFGAHLRYWWLPVNLHTVPRFVQGRHVICSCRTVLWYVKQTHRKVHSSPIPDVWQSKRDKTLHEWGQGDGVRVAVEHLTEPGDTIVDPFAGSGTWGRMAHEMGRRWIGADIVHLGSKSIQATPKRRRLPKGV
jgi:hypothetical protein